MQQPAAIADMARDAVRAALDGMRRGWENGGSLDAPLPRSSLPGYND